MARRVILIIIGSIVLLIGAAAAAGGAGLMIVFGTDDKASSGTHSVHTSGVALVAALDDVNGTNGFATAVGRPHIALGVSNPGRPVFVGVGPAKAVDAYLANAPIDRVTNLDLEPYRLRTTPQAGSAHPTAPTAQSFWTASASGTNARLDWKIKDGSYRFVIMNADASPNVAANTRASLTVPHLFAIGLGILLAGVILVIVGVLVIVLGARHRPRPQYDPPTYAAAPQA